MSKTQELVGRGIAELRRDPTIALLILANLILVLDTRLAGKPVASILVVYWLQMLIIGFWSFLKLVVIGRWMALLYVPIFGLMYLSLVNMLGFIIGGMIDDHLRGTPFHSGFDLEEYVLWGGVAFFASHGASFARNFIGKREYARISWENQVALPMMRAMPMWIAVVLAAVAGSIFDSVTLMTVLVIPVKIALDIAGHTVEHLILADLPRRGLEPEPT